MNYQTIKKHGSIELIKLNKPIFGGLYAVLDTETKKAKTGLNLDASLEIFNTLKNIQL